MLTSQYKKIVRASAIYDLLVAAPFATPWTFSLVIHMLGKFAPIAPFAPEHVLFANLMGSIVVIWSLVRIADPQPVYGLFDSASRALFFTWQVYFYFAYHITPVVLLFAVSDLTWLLIQVSAYWLLRKKQAHEPSSCRLVNYLRLRGC